MKKNYYLKPKADVSVIVTEEVILESGELDLPEDDFGAAAPVPENEP